MALITTLSAVIINAVFAATNLQIPVEIIWNDQSDNGGTRPSQVILHVRRSGSNENLKTVTLTQANEDPNDSNKWVTTIDGLTYNSSYSYQIHQENVTGYNITQSANVTVTTQLGIISHNQDSLSGNGTTRHYSNTNFIIIQKNNTRRLWTYTSYSLNTLNPILTSTFGNNYSFTSGNYETGASANLGIADVEYDSGYDEATLETSQGGSFTVYYGELGNIAQGSTVTLTDTLNVQTYTLTVHHLNEDGTTFAADTVTTYNSGATYTASPISNNRYTPELTVGQATGTITQNTEVTYVYHPKYHDVIYQFTGSVQPPNAAQLLPATAEHEVGATVTVAQAPTATGYRFLGWKINGVDAGTSFTMPTTDVTITGSWEQFNGYFTPTISKQITNPQSVYRYGDTVEFQIYVTNPESYQITNVEVDEQLLGAKFIAASGYTLSSGDTKAIISTIPAGGTVVLYAEYDIPDDITQTRTNTVEITAASADNYYFLDTSQTYMASVQFATQSWQDVPVLTGVNTNSTTLYYCLMVIGTIGVVGGVVIRIKTKIEREK
ncbi:Cna B-type domain-containing protein [Candidatus Saccharibacteria bacterium]|nr:Cna B-type domain-containing protein [Candidatus Saccharibacteria bacterium]